MEIIQSLLKELQGPQVVNAGSPGYGYPIYRALLDASKKEARDDEASQASLPISRNS